MKKIVQFRTATGGVHKREVADRAAAQVMIMEAERNGITVNYDDGFMRVAGRHIVEAVYMEIPEDEGSKAPRKATAKKTAKKPAAKKKAPAKRSKSVRAPGSESIN